jgi:hypothetical protein
MMDNIDLAFEIQDASMEVNFNAQAFNDTCRLLQYLNLHGVEEGASIERVKKQRDSYYEKLQVAQNKLAELMKKRV